MLNTIGGPTDGAKRNDSIGYGIVRPRVALQNPGDPGSADEYPLPDLAAAASASPSAEATGPNGTSAKSKENSTAVAASAVDGGSDSFWIGLGVGAAVLLGGVVTAVVVGRRRHARGT
jgi:hypothetical protein